MALTDEVQSRYGEQFLIGLTNPDAPDQTTLDTARLGFACTDVEADFAIHAGEVFDITSAAHVSIAVEGVLVKLIRRMGGNDPGKREDTYFRRLETLSKSGARDRVSPATNSQLTTSSELPAGGGIRRPTFDAESFESLNVGRP